MDYRLNVKDISSPEGLLRLKTAISEIADECDVLYTETAPNGSISARQGRIALYNNSGTYTMWMNVDGILTWKQIDPTAYATWKVDGTETQLTTADEIDMQSKKIINLADASGNQDAMTKAGHDASFNTSTGHDHDGTDSKKVLATNVDGTGLTNGHFLYNNSGTIAGKAPTPNKSEFLVRLTTIGAVGSSQWDETGGFDTNSDFASNKFTASIAGKYFMQACFKTGSADAKNLTITVRKNGSTTVFLSYLGAAGSLDTTAQISFLISLSASDYIEIGTEWASSPNPGITINNITSSWWSGFLIPNSVT